MISKVLPFELLPIGEDKLEKLNCFVNDMKYKSDIEIALLDMDESVIVVRIKQLGTSGNTEMDSKMMITLVKPYFSELLPEYKVRWRPIVFKGKEIENISVSWVMAKIAKHRIKQSVISAEMNIDKQIISGLLSGNIDFDSWHKAAFYYYFKYKEKLVLLNPELGS
jgi:hypothetical protein